MSVLGHRDKNRHKTTAQKQGEQDVKHFILINEIRYCFVSKIDTSKLGIPPWNG